MMARKTLIAGLTMLAVACGDDGSADGPRRAPSNTEWSTGEGVTSMRCRGRGDTPVVFLAGGADPGDTWDDVIEDLGPDVLTCVYDRPGVGQSDALDALVTPQAVADVLGDTLDAADVANGALLVGHSLGGLTLRLYGADRSDMLAGALFLDPTVPDPEDTILADELDDLGWDAAATVAQGAAVTRWPSDVPLTVLSHDPALAVSTGTWSEADQVRWSAGQRDYGMLTPSGTQRDVSDATHYVYRTRPDEVVLALRALLP
ncbi:MAG TPA: alpha/beta hydrolase [Polyangiaceae bacterium LLY-WYZ-14_1]|nr:alpha/beta hydrolase [Polyangiaceae bacterium LLY-WYZ-14_1]